MELEDCRLCQFQFSQVISDMHVEVVFFHMTKQQDNQGIQINEERILMK